MTGADAQTTEGTRLSPLAAGGLAALLALHLVLAWLIREPGITVRNDDALYLLLSRSLAQGHFNDAHLQGAPPHALYPPGYPALLALAAALAGERLDHFLLLNAILSAASLGLVFDLVRRRWSVACGFLVLVPLVVNNSLVRYAGSLVSEPAYLFFSTLVLWLLLQARVAGRVTTLATIALVVAGLTRSVGVVLLAAVVAWLLLERRPRDAVAVALAGGLCIGGWLLRTFLLPDEFRTIGRSYAEDVERMVARGGGYFLYKRLKIGVLYATTHLPVSLPLPGLRRDSALAAWGWGMAAVIPLGLVAAWRRGLRLVVLYLLAYLALLAAWRMSSPRFLAVILPLLVLALIVPFGGWLAAGRPRAGLTLAVLLAGLLTAGGVTAWEADWRAIRGCERGEPLAGAGCFNPDVRSFLRLARRTADVVPADAVVLTAREATFAYYSGRRTWYLNTVFAPDSLHILPRLEARGINFVVLAHTHATEPRDLAPALAGDCARLDLALAEEPRAFLFRLRPLAAGPGDGAACRALEAYRADPAPVPTQRK